MNEERRLLERVMYRIPSLVISEHDLDLVDEIKELLAQPETEPLSNEAICQILLKKEWKGFVDLVRMIEKAHGIGGGNEN